MYVVHSSNCIDTPDVIKRAGRWATFFKKPNYPSSIAVKPTKLHLTPSSHSTVDSSSDHHRPPSAISDHASVREARVATNQQSNSEFRIPNDSHDPMRTPIPPVCHPIATQCIPTAARTNSRNCCGCFRPDAASTPVCASTPAGRTTRIASATFIAFNPPARITGRRDELTNI